MVFSSSVFLFYFLPLFLICYFALPFKNLVLLVFSLYFYAWGEGLYVLLMIASGLGNFAIARWIAANSGSRARAILALGVALNLSGLFVFKYLGFFVASWNEIFPVAGLRAPQFTYPSAFRSSRSTPSHTSSMSIAATSWPSAARSACSCTSRCFPN